MRRRETDMNKKNKPGRVLLSFFMIMLITLLASCSGKEPDSIVKADTNPETETVRLAMFQNGHILNAIAEEQGYLEDEGIKVEHVPVETDSEVFEGIKNGTIDVASNSGTNLPLQQIADGQGLDWTLLMVTDVLRENSVLLASNHKANRDLPYAKLAKQIYDMPGVMSRKKQLLPVLLSVTSA